MSNAIIYNTETGQIVRELQGAVPLANQRLGDTEAIIACGCENIPGDKPVTEVDSIPDDATGKMVDVETGAIVDDPDYEPPLTTADIKESLERGDLTEREALLLLLE
jgi:hypothetical protein